MTPYFDIIVVVPVGPGTSLSFVLDTIQSFEDYTVATSKVIVMDDSHQHIGEQLQAIKPGLEVLKTSVPMGGWAGLYISLSRAYQFAIKHYKFKAILKLDTDALVINPKPEIEALELFAKDKSIGIAGQYPNEYNGRPWDIAWPRQRIINATKTWKFFARPIAHWALRKQFYMALNNGYVTGESVFGGAYFLSYNFVSNLYKKGLLPNEIFGNLNLGEDHLFALLAKASGFTLASLSKTAQPFACAWKGLPASPEQLYTEGKKIIHSVKSFENLKEEDIRFYYKGKRDAYIANIKSTIKQTTESILHG